MNKSLKVVFEVDRFKSSRDGELAHRLKIVEKGEEEEEHIGVEDVDNEDNLSQRPRWSI